VVPENNASKYTIENIGGRIDEFLKKTLDLAGFKLTFELSEEGSGHPELENPDILVKFTGRDVGLLLENKGELMLALEHLTLEALRVPSDRHAMICFDANDTRMMRMEELRLSALTAAERVVKTRAPFRFNPMSSRERRILHLALRAVTDIRSESAGFGHERSVVLYPADMPTPAQPPPLMHPPAPRGGPPRSGGGGRGGDRDRGGSDRGRDRRR
jgi:spoIIIJ-associated protein